jgi:ComF family protein
MHPIVPTVMARLSALHLDRIWDLFMPRTCIGCGAVLDPGSSGYACELCDRSYEYREPRGRQLFAGGPVAESLLQYSGTGEFLVREIKYHGGLYLEREIARLLQRRKQHWDGYFAGRTLVPVPLHWRRQRGRGYNQAAVIARGVRRVYPHLQMAQLLKRVQPTATQTRLDRKARERNVAAAFVLREGIAMPQKAMLTDDVLTSGATLGACVKVLRPAVGDISTFTLAHG